MVEVAIGIGNIDFEMIGEQGNLLTLGAKTASGYRHPVNLFLNWFGKMLHFDWLDIGWDNRWRRWQIIMRVIPVRRIHGRFFA